MFDLPLVINEEIDKNHDILLDKFKSLLNITQQINEGISMIDVNGVVILWNSFMEERYNIPASEMLGRKMSDFLEDTISERVLNTKVAMSDVYYSQKHDFEDQELYGYVYANPVYYENEFVGVICTEVDIIDASELSKELEATREKIKFLENEVKSLSMNNFDKILGKNRAIVKAKNIAKQVAKTNSSILITGEGGTGKEVFARAIHKYSERKGTFVPVNCGAIPPELFESEFFGIAPGAIRGGAKAGKSGIFELANGGTVFLDEISELPLNLQVKLLRTMREKKIRRIGGTEEITINVRIISATNKDLAQMVEEEAFREDLYYNLDVVEINLPPLRERKEDIGLLIYYFLERQCKENNKPFLKISKDAFKVLERHEWKGNIRELKSTVENMVVLTSKKTLDIDDIPNYILDSVNKNKQMEIYPMDLNEAIKRLEVNKIIEALEISKGNKSKAAKILNIPRTTLYYKIDAYNIE
ncbi:MAG: sigma 54-interacting transcriptional regulator [Peptostreptococcus porci]|uniref:sigma 54-interacting transcriptional regulator n=2 Tax=Peptostreptococcus porci TaxID=2652282 RepID=UPI0023F2ADCC|nr:sigma 54-interacting transcriptional regulator [Peptostreptococcus porci]MDD7183406.1 sigma 54-interacting transcriptional regulator [Peptostreptococcus porci]MDY4560179.1 sigma 54-interacting transcriptional regulator [Peptostreptococcus porci]MDY5479094.1 sigma 54-interacting transcriptional regulator [Peptostreptococcus porci]